MDLGFYKGKKVLVTGNTGFKGSWLCRILELAGADVVGYSLPAPTSPSLYCVADIGEGMESVTGDVRDIAALKAVFVRTQPEIVFHLAAQPIVRESYRIPRETYEVNVMGTVNVLECVRATQSVKSFVNITTDKVYRNDELPDHPFSEDEPLDGYDPYSNSKSCSELVTHSYKKAFFYDNGCAISTVRAGNVIGGGDFAKDRIIPDCIRAVEKGEKIAIRNPHSTRPYQHVLEPLGIYLTIAAKQYENAAYADCYNVGPDKADCVTTEELVRSFCEEWGPDAGYVVRSDGGPHEASFLMLDNGKIKRTFGWAPKLHIAEAVKLTVLWTRAYFSGNEYARKELDRQIGEYFDNK